MEVTARFPHPRPPAMAKRSQADVKYAIDLLWSHQIRRENAALHREVQRLQGELLTQADEVKELCADSDEAKVAAESALASVQRVQTEQDTLRGAVDTALREGEGAVEKATTLETSLQKARMSQDQVIAVFGKDLAQLRADLAHLRKQHQSDVRQMTSMTTDLRPIIETKCDSAELAGLKHRVDEIEAAVLQGQLLRSVSRIEDSISDQARGVRVQGRCDC
jgi:chromosome segregation ATPase